MVAYALILVFFLQAGFMFVDEFYYHRKRGLPKWECIGHPLDTLSLLLCLLVVMFLPYTTWSLVLFIALSVFSTVFIFKDFKVHAEHCADGEQTVHGVLYGIHPVLLLCVGLAWAQMSDPNDPGFLKMFFSVQTTVVFFYGIYQYVYWNHIWDGHSTH